MVEEEVNVPGYLWKAMAEVQESKGGGDTYLSSLGGGGGGIELVIIVFPLSLKWLLPSFGVEKKKERRIYFRLLRIVS